MTDMDNPTAQNVADWLREQLPAAEVRVSDDPARDSVTIEARFKAHGLVSGLNVVKLPARGVEQHLEQLVSTARREAIVNYGLQAELDAQIAEARQDGARDTLLAVTDILDRALEDSRDEDGVAPAVVTQRVDWLRHKLRRLT